MILNFSYIYINNMNSQYINLTTISHIISQKTPNLKNNRYIVNNFKIRCEILF